MTDEHGKPIVTFFEQYGAGGAAIAQKVAARLGVPFLHQAISSEQMEAAEAEAEQSGSALERVLRAFTPLPSPDVDITWVMDARTDYERVMDNTKAVLDAVEHTGGVLLGRNATIILAKTPGTLHVKVNGPVEDRVVRAAEEAGITVDQARKRQEREDRVRVELSRRLFRWDPSDDSYYDLVIDTGAFTLDQAAELVVDAYRLRFPE